MTINKKNMKKTYHKTILLLVFYLLSSCIPPQKTSKQTGTTKAELLAMLRKEQVAKTERKFNEANPFVVKLPNGTEERYPTQEMAVLRERELEINKSQKLFDKGSATKTDISALINFGIISKIEASTYKAYQNKNPNVVMTKIDSLNVWKYYSDPNFKPNFSKENKSPNSIPNKSTGSGFIVQNNGIVITNYHVVKNATKLEIVFPESKIVKDASLLLKDKSNDIAILQIIEFNSSDFSNKSIPFSIGESNTIKVGQDVFTVGFPLGSIMGVKPRLSSGQINSLFGIQEDPRLLQISNPLQPGNSGGPLFNKNGELVGIVVSGLNAEYFYENSGIIPQNVNFAIKINYLTNLFNMLPNADFNINQQNLLNGMALEEQIELINPFIVQIRAYE
ncbi:MAG: trypsin-like peptidase domain-containing protein [Candidatus Marinimicrobia bacterium]|mgnify:FL=1|jgi:S1-C subfamily serine protease|nr:trypsin-like peptidase domain-containing protein [Candidatus Neomarinimicrobiota bacterium]MBT4753034.1 trypsin-like peptidase domain-containing protein [Candidatus Neomarinimicrobiota bacterium]MBT5115550.1 trypsin-like peptidase domain-containing protein [Candidatus Neomarinimicrobiota bacterium]MBT6412810.1 trypsin-like peptidase domain-containing protein [Candidatus Neomarinimicrobiota bacterium]MBT6796922.1 trypsin-like peptidase domain-containing protein [Candidatus Neomarinimicrobiota